MLLFHLRPRIGSSSQPDMRAELADIRAAPKRVARSLLISGIRGVVAVLGGSIRAASNGIGHGAAHEDAPSVALIRLDLLGDIVFSLPAARLIKQRLPAARVTMVTLPQTAPLASLSPDVDRVIPIDTNAVRSASGLTSFSTWESLRRAIEAIRRERFDMVVSIYGLTASLLALLARSSYRLGYADEGYPNALDEALSGGRTAGARRHDWEFTQELLTHALSDDAGSLQAAPRIAVEPADRRSAGRLLESRGVREEAKLVVIHAGSGYGDFKRWPARSYAAVARELASLGCDCVLVGAAGDVDLASEIARGAEAASLAGMTTVAELCAVLERADLVISADSGPLHIATALGTRVIGLYGPTDPKVNGPRSWHGQEVVVLRRDIACSPCYSVRVRAECPLGDPVCMRLVGPETVIVEAKRMLGLDPG